MGSGVTHPRNRSRRALSVSEIDARIAAKGVRVRAEEQRAAPMVTVRHVDPAGLHRRAVPVCERCGVALPDGPVHACAARPRTEVAYTSPAGERSPRLSRRDRVRVLDWLAQNGPATARMAGWALELDRREVQLYLRSVEGGLVEQTRVLETGRRGTPPSVWRVKETAVAA